MQSTLTLLFILGFSLNGFCQNTTSDSSITCLAHWKKGEKRAFILNQTKSVTDSGRQTTHDVNSYEAVITVIDSTSEGYTLEWQNRPVSEIPGLGGTASGAIASLFLHLRILYRTNPRGKVDTLMNYQDIQRYVDLTLTKFKEMAKDKQAMEQTIKQLNAIFLNRKNVQNLVMRDVALFHSTYGNSYTLSKTVFAEEVPNIFGGEPLPGVVTQYILSLQPREDRVRIGVARKIDQEKAAKAIRKVLQKLSQGSGKPFKEGDLPDRIEISDKYTYDLNLSSGWIKRAYLERTIQLSDLTQVQTFEILAK